MTHSLPVVPSPSDLHVKVLHVTPVG